MTDNTLKMFIFFFHLTCFILKYEWNTSKLLACNVKSLLTGCWLNSTAFKCLWRKQFPLHLPWYKCESSPSVGWPPWCAACATSGRSALTCGFHTLSLQESSLYKGSGKNLQPWEKWSFKWQDSAETVCCDSLFYCHECANVSVSFGHADRATRILKYLLQFSKHHSSWRFFLIEFVFIIPVLFSEKLAIKIY